MNAKSTGGAPLLKRLTERLTLTLGVTQARAAAVVAGVALASLTIGCGPSPAYAPEPRSPVDYAPVDAPEPLSSEELARQQQAQAHQVAARDADDDVVIGAQDGEYADTDPSALTEWKPVLENHGTWVDDATYGTVWVPAKSEVGEDFQPYVTAGRWTYSDTDSWVWVSDYDWGWVPFHYGRWVLLPGHGWAWIPGRTYAGAWVTWRTGPVGYGYVGWAPMAPSWYWYNGVAVGWSFGWYTPRYVYCAYPHVYGPSVGTYVIRDNTPAGAAHAARTVPYQPAQPGVGGSGRVVATPGVGGSGRVVATPGVGGGRVVATPGVGGRGPGGPRPTDLGMKTDAVPAPPADDRKLARAQAFASPSTAKDLGAAPPSAPRPRRIDPDAVVGVSGPTQARPGMGPGVSPGVGVGPGVGPQRVSPSVASRLDPVVRAPQVQGVAPRPSYTPTPRVDRDGWGSDRPRFTDPTPFVAQPQPRPSPSPPSFGSTQRAAPLVEHWSRPSTPAPSSPTFGGSSPSYRPGPSFGSSSSMGARPSSPTFGSSSSMGVRPSSPTFGPSPSNRSSFGASSPSISRPSAPSFRSSPSVTLPRGGGGGGGSRAAPSVSRGVGGGIRGGRR